MNAVLDMTYEEFLAEQETRAATQRRQALQAPYTAIFRIAVESPDTGGGGTCMRLLLSLYNGARFKFDLSDLRRLDAGLHAAAIAVLQDEVGSASYVHDRIAAETGFRSEAIAAAMEWLAYDSKLRGRASKGLMPSRPGRFEFGRADA